MLRALTDKVDHTQEQVGSISRERKILREDQKEMPEIKNTEVRCLWWACRETGHR